MCLLSCCIRPTLLTVSGRSGRANLPYGDCAVGSLCLSLSLSPFLILSLPPPLPHLSAVLVEDEAPPEPMGARALRERSGVVLGPARTLRSARVLQKDIVPCGMTGHGRHRPVTTSWSFAGQAIGGLIVQQRRAFVCAVGNRHCRTSVAATSLRRFGPRQPFVLEFRKRSLTRLLSLSVPV